MIYKLFAIKDKALDCYSAPFTQATLESGLRMWRDLVLFEGSKDNRYRRNPNDYALYMIGDYDDENGKTMNVEKPVVVSTAQEVLLDQPQMEM